MDALPQLYDPEGSWALTGKVLADPSIVIINSRKVPALRSRPELVASARRQPLHPPLAQNSHLLAVDLLLKRCFSDVCFSEECQCAACVVPHAAGYPPFTHEVHHSWHVSPIKTG